MLTTLAVNFYNTAADDFKIKQINVRKIFSLSLMIHVLCIWIESFSG